MPANVAQPRRDDKSATPCERGSIGGNSVDVVCGTNRERGAPRQTRPPLADATKIKNSCQIHGDEQRQGSQRKRTSLEAYASEAGLSGLSRGSGTRREAARRQIYATDMGGQKGDHVPKALSHSTSRRQQLASEC